MGFDQLHSSVQHHVVNSVGWRDLRPLQEEAIAPILAGSSCLLLAPTAGGKTEAAILPVLSRMLSEPWQGLSVLYLCPIRALLNNLEERLSFYCSLVGRRCGLWHGDVGQASRSAILRDPPDILLTTPESLEAMLISKRTDRAHLFGSLQVVIVDEVHSFANDDRGWHLLAVIERIATLARRQPQRIGLSATIGNPNEILAWMTRGIAPSSRVIAPIAVRDVEPEVLLDYVGSIDNAALVVSRLNRGEKRLVFCDSRAQAERMASLLRSHGTTTFVSHSSLPIDDRRQAERAFRESRDCVIVATSTLELGIDVGDLDRVVQLDAPMTVSSFLQRLGRTGRRHGSHRNCLFLATHRESLLRAAALLKLWKQGYVEQLQPPLSPLPVAAQQVMAIIREHGGGSSRIDQASISQALGQPRDVTEQLLSHMLQSDILFEDSGILGFGQQGERLYGAKNYMPLMSVFDTPFLFRVMCGLEDLGSVHPLSFVKFGQQQVVLSLGGRGWEVVRLDRQRSTAEVRPAESMGRSRWLGGERALNFELCRAVRDLLVDDEAPVAWSKRAATELANARKEISVARVGHTVISSDRVGDPTRWWTFAGLKVNTLMAAMLQPVGGPLPRFDNYSIEIPQAINPADAEPRIRAINLHRHCDPIVFADLERSIKFWECIPIELRAKFLKERFTDPDRAVKVLNEPRLHLQLLT